MDSGKILPLASRNEFTLGRLSEGQPIMPDIDLTPYQAYASGVSRLHAVVKRDANEFAVRAAGGVRFETAGAGLTVDGMRLTSSGGGSEDFWRLTGNAGTTAANFLGTTDEQPLFLSVNHQPALRLFPDPLFQGLMLHSPNLVGGSPNNGITDGNAASVIAGGGTAAPLLIGLPWFGPVLSGGPNHIHSTLANVSGGGGNAGAIRLRIHPD